MKLSMTQSHLYFNLWLCHNYSITRPTVHIDLLKRSNCILPRMHCLLPMDILYRWAYGALVLKYTSIKRTWYHLAILTFCHYDINDHLYKISYWKQYIVGNTQYLFLTYLEMFSNVSVLSCSCEVVASMIWREFIPTHKFTIEDMVIDIQYAHNIKIHYWWHL